MSRTITTAAELDALPVGSVVRNLSRGIAAERLADGRGVIPGNPTACPWGSLWSAGSHIVVLYDPSAPAPAPSATRDEVARALFAADPAHDYGADEFDRLRGLRFDVAAHYVAQADALLTHFAMTPKEDR